jgi:hypothetical protein
MIMRKGDGLGVLWYRTDRRTAKFHARPFATTTVADSREIVVMTGNDAILSTSASIASICELDSKLRCSIAFSGTPSLSS